MNRELLPNNSSRALVLIRSSSMQILNESLRLSCQMFNKGIAALQCFVMGSSLQNLIEQQV